MPGSARRTTARTWLPLPRRSLKRTASGEGARARPEYVLGRFGPDEAEAANRALERARHVVRIWSEEGLETAMKEANRRDLDPGRARP